jgi:hypothetical protein
MRTPASVLCLAACVCLLAADGRAEEAAYRFEVSYATLFGGSEYDDLREVILSADGSVLLGGQTLSGDLPVTPGVVQAKYGGEPAGTGHTGLYGGDCCLARLSADGAKVLFATYFGGSKQERDVYGMALDRKGNLVITTTTRSDDLLTTDEAFQRCYGGGAADIAVAKLSPDGKDLLWCTYLGGTADETPRGGLGLDKEDNVYVVGTTSSPNFPTTDGVLQPRLKGKFDAVVVKLKADGSGLVWSTLLGGSDWDGLMGVRIDAAGNVHVAGHTQSADFPVTAGAAQARLGGASDCFLAALSPDARRLLYATFLGGSGNEFAEHRPWLFADGCLMLTGVTGSADFPTTPGAPARTLKGKTDGFVAKLSADGKRFLFSTFLGGAGGEFFLMPTPDARGNLFVVGQTSSPDFPVTPGCLQPKYGGGASDAVLAVLSRDGSRVLYATYLGGSGEDLARSMALGPGGEVYVVGRTDSKDFPTTKGAAQAALKGGPDAFVVKLAPKKTGPP